jgi:hypothetical protein
MKIVLRHASLLIALVAAVPVISATAQSPEPTRHKEKSGALAAAVNAIVSGPAVSRAHWGVSVVNLD